jgi:hypothetical protein
MRKVIYTCITDKHDVLKEPMVKTEGWDYVCFTDEDLDYKGDTWKIIKIGLTDDRIRHQRKKKIFNEYIFDTYDLSVWCDGSMYINCDLDKFIKPFLDSETDLAIMKHPAQTCIVGEARGILMLKKDKQDILEKQINDYFAEGYPKNYGVVASGVIIRKHTDDVVEFCKLWYEQIKKYSLRDQMSFGYALWKKPIKHILMPFSIIYNQFKITNHKKKKEII